MHFALLGLAFSAAAWAAPVVVDDTSVAPVNVDVSKAINTGDIDTSVLDTRAELQEREGILGLGGVVKLLLTQVNGLVGEVEGTVVDVVKAVDPSLAHTLEKLLKQLGNVVDEVEDTVEDVVDGETNVAHLVDQVNDISSELDKLLVKVVKVVDPSVAALLKTLLGEVSTLVKTLETTLGLTKRQLLDLGILQVDDILNLNLDDLVSIDLSGLVSTVFGLVGDIEGLVLDIVSDLEPTIAKTLKGLLNELCSLLSGIEDAVDLKAVLKDVNTLTSHIDQTLVHVISIVDSSLAKEVDTLLKALDKILKAVEHEVIDLLD